MASSAAAAPLLLTSIVLFYWCASLGVEGRALLRFQERTEVDPHGAIGGGGDRGDRLGVERSGDGGVVVLNLKDLQQTVASWLGKLSHMKSMSVGSVPIRKLLQGYKYKGGHGTIAKNRTSSIASLTSPTEAPSPSPFPSHVTLKSKFSPSTSPFLPPFHSPGVSPSPISLPPTTKPSPSPSPVHHSNPNFESAPPSTLTFAPIPEGPSPYIVTSVDVKHKNHRWKVYGSILSAVSFLLVSTAVYVLCCRAKVVTVRPWATGLSGQLQKAFVTGVPVLKRSEIVVACEDFSNIIGSLPDCILYKGTLSSGVEIVVMSSLITSAKDWPKQSETLFRKKISMLSKVNHKNFINLLGYCEEGEPFTRMMVFEYAPNGTLFEHLHSEFLNQHNPIIYRK